MTASTPVAQGVSTIELAGFPPDLSEPSLRAQLAAAQERLAVLGPAGDHVIEVRARARHVAAAQPRIRALGANVGVVGLGV